MQCHLPPLPIHAVLDQLRHHCAAHHTVILAAEPGSGKTTIVPLALLDEPWLAGQKIIMLEPRRLAVRMAAKRMSELCQDRIGNLVGYRIRFDTKVSPQTRIEVVTEGVLTRMIQSDPGLSGVGLVIFDEFHERTLMADLGLALCSDVQELRDDLRIILMSATMDNDRISQVLDTAPVITGTGRCYPVTTEYLDRTSTEYLVPRTVKAIHRALTEQEGDILVFLPGAGDIKRVLARMTGDCCCLPLYGSLPQEEQDRVFLPSDQRRVILATPIAETSLTIEGVTVVIDSGLMNTPRFSTATGLTSLCTVEISKASARQRAGRAGRLSAGTCYRLWTHGEHHSRGEFTPPEIRNADLAPLLLETLQWGVGDPRELRWIDPPRQSQINQAETLLGQLGILDQNKKLTPLGQQIAALPLHPRLALMLVRGREQGHGPLACTLATLLQHRDLFRTSNQHRSADIEERLELLHLFAQNQADLVQARGGDPARCRKCIREADQYKRLLNIHGTPSHFEAAGSLLAFAYPDRIAMQKQGANQYILSSGRGVLLGPGDHLRQAEFLVVPNLDGGQKQGRIFLAASLSKEDILEHHQHLLKKEDQVTWNKTRVAAVSCLKLGELELSRTPLQEIDPEVIQGCLIAGIQQEGMQCLGWEKKSRELQARMQSVHIWAPAHWPDVSDAALLDNLDWLIPYLDKISSLKQLHRLDLYQILHSRLSWAEQQKLEQLAPSHFRVPSGTNVKLTYQPGEPPVLAVRLQELFGATATPTICNGEVPVLIHLLSPANRPIQVTRDLAGFWHNTYHEVKKELMGRYPKHYWPDDPLSALATARIKPRKR